ncbi:DNA-binding transcriptional regulator, CsgD family [Aureimonas jatrophae]|uniref:DNA-binding transcriptional regulator, CsgD family n=2 Tax=Aureimonas jatrophae TaxID=1166073 RepID=A0A1H0K3K3_9HYPH|nr:DNA-binding transcriptional regulator, CsgD family [Aureimonas jatrophae]
MQESQRRSEVELPTVEDMRTAWGMTPAESRLAVLMLKPMSLQDASRHLGISIETARTHLKALFAKTQTNRQAELVIRLLATARQ